MPWKRRFEWSFPKNRMVPPMVPDGSVNLHSRFAHGFRWFRDGSGMVPCVSLRACQQR